VTQPEPTGRAPQIFDRGFLTDMEDVTQVILVRHGEQYVPDWRGGPIGDTIDPPLSERGVRQAELVGLRFSTQRIDAVYASPLRRALETGRQVARHHRLEPVVWADLREVEVFRHVPPEKTAAEFIGRELLAGIRERFLYERSWDVYPHSETSADFRRRTVNAIEAIIAANEGKRVVVACHGGVINAYIGHIIRSPYDMFFRPAHTSVSVVAAAGGIRAVHSLNDVHHLFHGEESFVSH
jgi:broad specificity phosphatase PhoE